MASSSAAGNSKSMNQFPLELCFGVLQDLLVKELEARFFPTDTGKQLALEAAKASVSRRLGLITSKIAALSSSELAAGLGSLVQALWSFLSQHAQLTSISPAWLDSSVTLETLSAVFQAACKATGETPSMLLKGGFLVSCALSGVVPNGDESPLSAEARAHLVVLMEWWADEVCAKRWHVSDAWLPFVIDGEYASPLQSIAQLGDPALVPLAIAGGCSVNEPMGLGLESAAVLALQSGKIEVLDAFVAHGLDLLQEDSETGEPLALQLVAEGAGHSAFFAELLKKRPEMLRATAMIDPTSLADNILAAAIISGDPALVDVVLSAGASVEHRYVIDIDREGRRRARFPTLLHGVTSGNLQILELLLTKAKVLEGWRDKYDKDSLGLISVGLAKLAASGYLSNPHFKGDPKVLLRHNPQAKDCVELILSSGILCPWDDDGINSLLVTLYPCDDGVIQGCILAEADARALLERFLNAGFEICRWYSDAWAATPMPQPDLGLHHAAVCAHQLEILDWCLSKLGLPADHTADTGETLLRGALTYANGPAALLLLEKYKVRAAYPGLKLTRQPIWELLQQEAQYDDVEAARLVDALTESSPTLFDLDCFSEASINELEAGNKTQNSILPWNPLVHLAYRKRNKALEVLLKKKLPAVMAMANRPVRMTLVIDQTRSLLLRLTPAQWATKASNWEGLELLLRHTDARVTDTFCEFGSTADLVANPSRSSGRAPRAIIAMVEARAKQEMEQKRKGVVGTATASVAAAASGASVMGSATNAFEDPSLTVRAKSGDGGRTRTKTRASKKKGKRKKPFAATAATGGVAATSDSGSDGSSDDDDDDEVPFEELDDNLVDSRYAPSLDLLLEQMRLKREAGPADKE